MKKQSTMILAGIVALLFLAIPVSQLVSAESKKKVLFFTLTTEWQHPSSAPGPDGTSPSSRAIARICDELGFDMVSTSDGSVFDGDLSSYAAFVFFTGGNPDKAIPGKIPVSPQGKKRIFEAVRQGTGLLGIHCAAFTWRSAGPNYQLQTEEKRSPFVKMLGGEFNDCGSIQKADFLVTEPVQLPSLTGLKGNRFSQSDEYYTMKNFGKDIHVICVQDPATMNKDGNNACFNRPPYPAVWARMEEKGRVAYTTFGHVNESWQTSHAFGIFRDLLAFVSGKLDIDLTPNLEKVCPQFDTLKLSKKP